MSDDVRGGSATVRYQLTSDGDHDYAIPVDKSGKWEEWMVSENWDAINECQWAIRIDGRFTFTDPRNG